MRCRLQFEPSFVEEAVFWKVRSLEAQGECLLTSAYHAERDSIYPVRDKLEISNGVYEGAKSEQAFQEFYASFFLKLGLRSLFEDFLVEFPLLDGPEMSIYTRRAFGKREEGSELYREGDLKTVLLSLQTKRILEGTFLRSFIRHELLRISDMLDPRFKYSPEAFLGGQSPTEENLIRDRFRFLWNLYIDRRLGRRLSGGRAFSLARPTSLAGLGQDLSDSKAFREIAKQDSWTQGELLELARNERISEMLAQGGFQCPLCGFHSYERISDWREEDALIIQEIEKDRADWKPSAGACRQCFELYHSGLKVVE